ncbi:sugar transferase, PEP-CTERM/EpsH1 system associated [Catalinimonas alkaloidigena]|uniref:Sugar transferase, PEP-CTERM/EpsH1 system associated n=1 Tax=Catalinimonas alkaloidigena TaxID=1075417 RepID=A0A1G9B4Z2_9BACT|nr:glycosyltransferase [Catalinimonas alkaloidigena]SDK33885.1 sugar transferase, PEP-CTERM/EpsH1 system associated [Catalinimonas alkaloidigena]
MKILVAASRFPWPLEKGDKLRLYHQLHYLSQHHEVYLICLAEALPTAAQLRSIQALVKRLEVIPLPLPQRLAHLASGLLNSLPFQVNYFRSPLMRKRVRALVKAYQIDVVYTQLIRLGENIPTELETPRYLDYMDALSEGMRKRGERSPWWQRPLIAVETRRLRRYELTLMEHFQRYSMITDADAAIFPRSLRASVDVIANGISPDFLQDDIPPAHPQPLDLIFTGNMGYHPNVLAACYLVDQLVPLLKEQGQSVTVGLVGVRPAAEVRRLESPEVLITGFVPDLRPYLKAARIMVAPLFTGSGLQNKLLEAMALGVPVVTTPLANRALGAQPGEEILEGATAAELTRHIVFLLTHPDEARRLGAQGQAFVRERYDWQKANRRLERSLIQLAEQKLTRSVL